MRMLAVLVFAGLITLGISEYVKYEKRMVPKPADIEFSSGSVKVSVQLAEGIEPEYKAVMSDLTEVFVMEAARALDHAKQTGQKDWITIFKDQIAGLKDNVDLTRRILMTPKDIQIPKVGKGDHHH